MYVDSHAHLEMEQFNADREQVLTRARDNGIETIVAIGSGSGPESLDCGIQLAEQYGFVYATIRIHPHEAMLASEAAFEKLERLSKRPRAIRSCELGLADCYHPSARHVPRQ